MTTFPAEPVHEASLNGLASPAEGTGAAGEVLSVRDLEIAFEVRGQSRKVVTGVSFGLQAGETLGLVGESGSGKTVTALAAMGLLGRREKAKVWGSVRLGDRELVGRTPRSLSAIRGDEISMIFQDPVASLNPALTIGEQIVETVRAHRDDSRSAARRATIDLLGRVGIPSPSRRISSYPHELSGGMCQRVMIAIALACRPKVLIADEPTTALDVSVQAQVLELLRSLQTELGMAILFITHDLAVIADCADRVAVMYAGEIVEESDVIDLYRRPVHPYTEALLAATPRIDRPDRRPDIAPSVPSADAVPVRPHDSRGCRFAARCPYVAESCLAAPVGLTASRGRRVRCLRAGELRLTGTENVR